MEVKEAMEDFLRGVPIEKCRGIENIDTNDAMLVVQASVELVANSLSTQKNILDWKRDIFDREIEVPDFSFLVFQFLEHSWTIVYGFYSLPRQGASYSVLPSVGEQEANFLSASLQTKSIVYEVSDTGNYIKYQFFNSGQSIEHFFYTAETEEPDDYEQDWQGTYRFQSCSRQLQKEDIGYPHRFVDQFLREQEVYIPSIPIWYRLHAGERVTLRNMVKGNMEFERMDCLVMSV